ncbi:hypothetical protein GCM10009760_25730 [Kitasatospora kazusensis]|uniref:Uncharacterized protein n=1 Tax=Kitasatospora kazusensis TaxID=407974 RepID=A0ABN2ZFN4_9ACTN
MSKWKKILPATVLALIAYWLGANTYYYNAANAGIAIGSSEDCQLGIEWRGTPGIFAYCN